MTTKDDIESYFFIRLLACNFIREKKLPLKVMHPLTGIPNRFRKDFFEDIGQENKQRVFQAINYYMENKDGKEER